MITFHFHLQPQYKYELFHINFTSCHCTGRYELNKLTSLPMCGFIAQLVEHRTGIAEVTGSNPVEALIFFRLLLSNISLSLCPLVDLSPIHMTWMLVCYNSRLFGRNQLETVYGIFLIKTFKIDIIRSVVVTAHRKFSINFTLILFVRCLCN